jgi:hypothetical protein
VLYMDIKSVFMSSMFDYCPRLRISVMLENFFFKSYITGSLEVILALLHVLMFILSILIVMFIHLCLKNVFQFDNL